MSRKSVSSVVLGGGRAGGRGEGTRRGDSDGGLFSFLQKSLGIGVGGWGHRGPGLSVKRSTSAASGRNSPLEPAPFSKGVCMM